MRCCAGVQKRNPVCGGNASPPMAAQATAMPQTIKMRANPAALERGPCFITITSPECGLLVAAETGHVVRCPVGVGFVDIPGPIGGDSVLCVFERNPAGSDFRGQVIFNAILDFEIA